MILPHQGLLILANDGYENIFVYLEVTGINFKIAKIVNIRSLLNNLHSLHVPSVPKWDVRPIAQVYPWLSWWGYELYERPPTDVGAGRADSQAASVYTNQCPLQAKEGGSGQGGCRRRAIQCSAFGYRYVGEVAREIFSFITYEFTGHNNSVIY